MITYNIETLRNPSLDFDGTEENLKHIIMLLEFELKTHPQTSGVGLSAIQINVPVKVAIVRLEKLVLNLINAQIIHAEQPYEFEGEGCLSLPGYFCKTKRYNLITLRNGDGSETKYSGYEAAVIQHEIDHWHGIIFTDRKINA